MSNHVVLQVNDPSVWGGTPDSDLLIWLNENVGTRCYDITTVNWSRKPCWLARFSYSKTDPFCYTYTSDSKGWIHFHFSNPDHAILFKLTWGGV